MKRFKLIGNEMLLQDNINAFTKNNTLVTYTYIEHTYRAIKQIIFKQISTLKLQQHVLLMLVLYIISDVFSKIGNHEYKSKLKQVISNVN